MSSLRSSCLLAFAAVLITTFSCNILPGQPSLSNVRMATDDTGKVSTISYSPRDDFFVFAELNGLKIGSVVEAKWFAVNLPEIEPNSEINTSDYVYQPLIESVYFRLTTPNGGDWPIGTYKVEIYLDGQLVGGQSFMVQ